jgi:hypothetical protein
MADRSSPLERQIEGSSSSRVIRSEARGPHWVAWVADTAGNPQDSVVVVGETREEAEERARRWADGQGR